MHIPLCWYITSRVNIHNLDCNINFTYIFKQSNNNCKSFAEFTIWQLASLVEVTKLNDGLFCGPQNNIFSFYSLASVLLFFAYRNGFFCAFVHINNLCSIVCAMFLNIGQTFNLNIKHMTIHKIMGSVFTKQII